MAYRYDSKKIDGFAESLGFHYRCIDPQEFRRHFLNCANDGIAGRPSCLAMLDTPFYPDSPAVEGLRLLALDAGGSRLRAAIVRVSAFAAPQIENEIDEPMVALGERVSGKEFFDRMAQRIAGLLEKAAITSPLHATGFCFSWPMRMCLDGDGQVISLSKEMDVYDLVGSFAGKELSAALQRIGAPDCGRMVLLNDTVATLFSGLPMVNSSVLEKDRAAFLGFVLGTGCNIACKNPSTGRVTVLESGNYHGGFVSSLDEDFDAQLKDPGKYALEKATAGAYLGPLSLLAIQKALESDCLQVAQPEKLMALSTLDTKTLNAFLRRDLDAASPFIQLIGSDESAQAVRYLCTILARRSALIAALGLCSCVDFIRQNQEVEAVNIAVDGSTWRLYHGIRENMEAWLRSFLQDSGPVELSLVAPDRASLIGAALASQSIEAQHF